MSELILLDGEIETQEDLDHAVKLIYTAWYEDGTLSASEALEQICMLAIGPIQDQIKTLKKSEDQARIYISELVNALGGQVTLPGFGELQITSPSISYSYDKKLVTQLSNQLRSEGLGEVAARLDQCMKPSEKAGSLRITREKKDD
jgi:hypothetical protein